MRLTLKLFTSLSKVYVNQGVVNWFLVINKVNLLFYIIRRNSPHKTGKKLHSQAPYFREMKSTKLILSKVSSLSMIQIFDECTVEALLKIYIPSLYKFTLSWFSLSFEISRQTIWYSWRIKVNFFLCCILNLMWMHKKNILKFWILLGCYQNRNPSQAFSGYNVISKVLKKFSLVESLFN